MDSGLYAACTALISRTQALDTIANNLANANTTGYRAQNNIFSSVLADAGHQAPGALNQAINNYGILSGTKLDLGQGALQKTGNNLDFAIQGNGFFTVQTANGQMYTRDGGFKVSATGQLTTQSGDPIMGDKGVIQLLPGATPNVSPDGTISENGAVIARIKLVNFPAGTNITSVGEHYYTAPAGTATADTTSTMQQGAIESSNVNPIESMVQLVDAQRSAEMMQRALAMFNSEIDKTATQDLPKV
jgi:flagellar basal-body rod protein FlgF